MNNFVPKESNLRELKEWRTAASIKQGCEERLLDSRVAFGLLYEYAEQLERRLSEEHRDAERYRKVRRALQGGGSFDVYESVIRMKDYGSCPSDEQFDTGVDALPESPK